jgi:hypothetical protein
VDGDGTSTFDAIAVNSQLLTVCAAELRIKLADCVGQWIYFAAQDYNRASDVKFVHPAAV